MFGSGLLIYTTAAHIEVTYMLIRILYMKTAASIGLSAAAVGTTTLRLSRPRRSGRPLPQHWLSPSKDVRFWILRFLPFGVFKVFKVFKNNGGCKGAYAPLPRVKIFFDFFYFL